MGVGIPGIPPTSIGLWGMSTSLEIKHGQLESSSPPFRAGISQLCPCLMSPEGKAIHYGFSIP